MRAKFSEVPALSLLLLLLSVVEVKAVQALAQVRMLK